MCYRDVFKIIVIQDSYVTIMRDIYHNYTLIKEKKNRNVGKIIRELQQWISSMMSNLSDATMAEGSDLMKTEIKNSKPSNKSKKNLIINLQCDTGL